MRLSINKRVVLLNVLSLTVLAAAFLVTVEYYVTSYFESEARAEVERRLANVQEMIDDSLKRLSEIATQLANREGLDAAIEEQNTPAARKMCKEVMEITGATLATITDKDGKVIARGHGEKTADSVRYQTNIAKSLAGEVSHGIEEGTLVRLSFRGGAPVKNKKGIVGAVIVGCDSLMNHNFVDSVKKAFDLECTFFQNDERVSTTLTVDGVRATGTKMDNPDVLRTVLDEGQTFISNNRILGKDYISAYWPLKGAGGRTVGMMFIGKSRDTISRASQAVVAAVIAATCVISVLVAIGMTFIITRTVTSRLGQAATTLKEISETHDLTKRLSVRSRDEIGDIAHRINEFLELSQALIGKVANEAATLATSSTELSTTAAQLTAQASETTSQSYNVVASVQQLAASMDHAASISKQMSGNAATVASAVEQLTTSITEVARNTDQAAQVADSAASLAHLANATVGELGNAAEEIGRVIEFIEEIADETNLLALNAAIEAARAGEAGKGFAVVATEVKELARQTGNATEDIRKRVKGIQHSASQAIRSIGEISQVITKVNDSFRAIAETVEEQCVTTGQIAKRIADTAADAESVSQDVAESAAVGSSITATISTVDLAARQTAEGATRTQYASQDLAQIAEQLRLLVDRFQI